MDLICPLVSLSAGCLLTSFPLSHQTIAKQLAMILSSSSQNLGRSTGAPPPTVAGISTRNNTMGAGGGFDRGGSGGTPGISPPVLSRTSFNPAAQPMMSRRNDVDRGMVESPMSDPRMQMQQQQQQQQQAANRIQRQDQQQVLRQASAANDFSMRSKSIASEQGEAPGSSP